DRGRAREFHNTPQRGLRGGKTVSFGVRSELRASGGTETGVWILGDDAECAEIAKSLGFNCFRWRTCGTEILYADPQFLAGGSSPTRTGVPILFPFPNRIRDGRFSWAGKAYELPRNDPSGKNAIHGFACRRDWRIVGVGGDYECAWLTGEFHGARDAPD